VHLAEFVATSAAVGSTRSRRRKVDLLADLLRQVEPAELPVAATYLAGRTRQGRVSVGWRTLSGIDVAPAAASGLELLDVDAAADELLRVGGEGSRATRERILAGLLGRATADEQRWLRGLLTGELRQGALDGIVAQALAHAWAIAEAVVRRALMLSGDLGVVAEAAASGGSAALEDFRLVLFRPVQPMLAQTAADIDAALSGLDRAAVEVKFDGTRVQAHRDGDAVRLYSRSLREVTAELPEVVEVVAGLPVRCAVLDGEALGMDPEGRPVPFQDTMRARGSAGVRGIRPFFFDLLHLDGRDLLDAPLAERRSLLTGLLPDTHLAPSEVIEDPAAGLDALRAALEAGHEGVMVKALDTGYEAGSRGASWRKVKPVHTLDLVVLAVEWGSGRRRGWLSNIHLGARDADGGFVMLGKTFKGLTDEMLAWQTERFLELEDHRDGHVVHVRPQQVVEVAFDGVQRSSRYPGGLALRFARVRRYRDDKTADEADTIDTVRAIHAGKALPRL
jgi:DNA ligase 1